jgi:hypothetical protein
MSHCIMYCIKYRYIVSFVPNKWGSCKSHSVFIFKVFVILLNYINKIRKLLLLVVSSCQFIMPSVRMKQFGFHWTD